MQRQRSVVKCTEILLALKNQAWANYRRMCDEKSARCDAKLKARYLRMTLQAVDQLIVYRRAVERGEFSRRGRGEY